MDLPKFCGAIDALFHRVRASQGQDNGLQEVLRATHHELRSLFTAIRVRGQRVHDISRVESLNHAAAEGMFTVFESILCVPGFV